ncbi:hypothetical protein HDU99_001311, partial [Rhizoclosmatium hyalinum]
MSHQGSSSSSSSGSSETPGSDSLHFIGPLGEMIPDEAVSLSPGIGVLFNVNIMLETHNEKSSRPRYLSQIEEIKVYLDFAEEFKDDMKMFRLASVRPRPTKKEPDFLTPCKPFVMALLRYLYGSRSVDEPALETIVQLAEENAYLRVKNNAQTLTIENLTTRLGQSSLGAPEQVKPSLIKRLAKKVSFRKDSGKEDPVFPPNTPTHKRSLSDFQAKTPSPIKAKPAVDVPPPATAGPSTATPPAAPPSSAIAVAPPQPTAEVLGLLEVPRRRAIFQFIQPAPSSERNWLSIDRINITNTPQFDAFIGRTSQIVRYLDAPFLRIFAATPQASTLIARLSCAPGTSNEQLLKFLLEQKKSCWFKSDEKGHGYYLVATDSIHADLYEVNYKSLRATFLAERAVLKEAKKSTLLLDMDLTVLIAGDQCDITNYPASRLHTLGDGVSVALASDAVVQIIELCKLYEIYFVSNSDQVRVDWVVALFRQLCGAESIAGGISTRPQYDNLKKHHVAQPRCKSVFAVLFDLVDDVVVVDDIPGCWDLDQEQSIVI